MILVGSSKERKISTAVSGAAILIGSSFASRILFSGSGPAVNDIPYLALILIHCAWFVRLLSARGRCTARRFLGFAFFPEVLLSLTLLFFLFTYIYALNANMDYVQRFIESGGALRLSRSTAEEQLLAVGKFLPFFAADLYSWLSVRLSRKRLLVKSGVRFSHAALHLPLVLVSAFLAAISFPSFLSVDGFGFLAWIAFVPVFLVLKSAPPGRAIAYGICFGVFYTTVGNYWLGTFNLVSLQITIIIFTGFYTLFMIPAVFLVRSVRFGNFLVLPLAWTAFDYLRSLGFLGFPWGMIGTSQHGFLPLIQTASVTGVWGVTFIVLLVNSAVADFVRRFSGMRSGNGSRDAVRIPADSGGGSSGWKTRYFGTAQIAAAVVLGLSVAGGLASLLSASGSDSESGRTVRVSLIQQNSDPRKDDYEHTFESLKRLTLGAVKDDPDLIVWSETAFVPNIRRWGAMDPESHPNARLVHEFFAFQKSLGKWLLTGNDDYDFFVLDDGSEVRTDYNAAVLFDPDGTRTATYHKNHLVPFTEYFPLKKQLPAVYDLLKKFDVNLWEPGDERLVFRHPDLRFSTPICFEDSFPGDIREFVLGGTEAIVNISNDYWSLNPVEAKQHYVGAMFRAVENRRPLLRATASGLTAYVDPEGRLLASLPYYEEGFLTVDVPIGEFSLSVYTRFGDWFPVFCLPALAALLIVSIAARFVSKKDPVEP